MKKVAINGFGRIGRLFFRQALENKDFQVIAINDLGDINNLAYLLKYDSSYRKISNKIEVKENNLFVDDREIKIFQERDAANLPWKSLDIDLVVEATGVYNTFEKASVHTEVAGAKKVVITAPAKDEEGVKGGKTVLMGVNHDQLASCNISSNGSCTTNATSPLIAILSLSPGIEKAMLTTIHGYTATQSIVDSPSRSSDFRKTRAAAMNIIPSTTGAAIAVTRVLPHLENKFDGIAMRVPVITGSIVDLTFVSKNNTSAEEINNILTEAASSSTWKNLIKVTTDQIVSSDIIGEEFGAVIDLGYTKVVDKNLVKVLAWYDNEWGYVKTLIEHTTSALRSL
ncbi:MAG: type I glyceraldehyde-3-phosphate dehydrogenase [Candidatus Harrisonbacteria bacterium CG10_big_fil_rev_8_21_14_0_10_38_8]|uniref:Type I glyceraldehyde-3-phosphate dehydrogenase n=1 Tax=Candidatus Harrisonbacteria bacterium CG10_big_fil_rev_8_21_14_0_10_38_8 TaxID=1974582 RepID=A0A2M6WJM9_9BACT|nr:MAG: type I glyceraldehyde-3-phosphate dehydrogenase [Candidatus Harrisonbacteria bacterium CG10_big_fil_rev_8_21_14_0_10_38_8]